MTFILSANFVKQLGALRQDYEKETGVDLTKTAQPYSFRILFGAKDVHTRNKHVSFIEQWMTIFLPKNNGVILVFLLPLIAIC